MIQSLDSHEGALLLTLEDVSRLLAHSHDAVETLANIVELIHERFHTDVCSVYLYEPERRELVLASTQGLKAESVGCVRMGLAEGLTGLVAERRAPVMVDDAFHHPRFKYFSEAGEDPYHSFLGVPLLEAGNLQGVLVVQTREPRSFSPGEVRMLVTVASQLASLVSGARLMQCMTGRAPAESSPLPAPPSSPVLQGVSLSSGLGVGSAFVLKDLAEERVGDAAPAGTAAEERARLAAAMEAAREELARLSAYISELVGEEHGAILQAQLMMLQDRGVERDLEEAVREGRSAEQALAGTLRKYCQVFRNLADPTFREREYDVKDVFRRMRWYLQAAPRTVPAPQAERLVLAAPEASVSALFAVDLTRLAAVVVEEGGPQSHAAILARSLGIPMVGQLGNYLREIRPHQRLVVDGSAGLVYVDPPAEALTTARAAAREAAPRRAGGSAARKLPPSAPRLEATINFLGEVPRALEAGAAGVGLYRTEFLFLARRTLPTEEEQVLLYRKLLTLMEGRPVTFRTFDLRPDKLAGPHQHLPAAESLDWRNVLTSPTVQTLFRDQVRAILRAATAGPARILVPMVSHTEQLEFVLRTLQTVRLDLEREGLQFRERTPLGVMIEVPGAAKMLSLWAPDVDFFTLGTNDLWATTLGIDRSSQPELQGDQWLHPGWLRLLHETATAARFARRPMAACGEMAAHPLGALVLASLGIQSLGVAVQQLEAVSESMRSLDVRLLAPVVRRAIHASSVSEARRALEEFRDAAGVGPLTVPLGR